MKYLKHKNIIQLSVLIIILGVAAVYYNEFIYASANDPDMVWLSETTADGKTGYKIVKPLGMESRVVGGPFARGFMRWGPKDIEKKLTLFPKDGVPEVTSPGFDKKDNSVLIFYDADALKKYGTRPYYAVSIYGGESVQLKEIEEEYTREIGRTGVYISRIPMNYNIQHLRIHKVFVQAPPPEKTYEITWNNKVEIKFTPDCDC
jgi:hypothetical protein